jgi:hypothetical protein
MAEKMAGSSTAKVPAWKLRQQQRQNAIPERKALSEDDDLGGTRSSLSRGGDELGGAKTRLPAWKLRELSKKGRGGSFDDDSSSVVSSGSARSSFSRGSVSSNASCHPSRAVSRVPDDPNLPPAFRLAARKKNPDDFLSLTSVHSRSRTDACSRTTANSYGSASFEYLDSDDDDDSFDDQDSFASLDSDADEDDEAYRESKNQLARLKIQQQRQHLDSKRGGKSRFKKKTMGTTLDFIAE